MEAIVFPGDNRHAVVDDLLQIGALLRFPVHDRAASPDRRPP